METTLRLPASQADALERLARATRHHLRTLLEDPAFIAAMDAARPLSGRVERGLSVDQMTRAGDALEEFIHASSSALGGLAAAWEGRYFNEWGYLGRAAYFAWLADSDSSLSIGERDALTEPWRLVGAQDTADWAGPKTLVVERMLSRVRVMTEPEGRAMAADWRAIPDLHDVRSAWLREREDFDEDDPRSTWLLAAAVGQTRARHVLAAAGLEDPDLDDASWAVRDAIAVVIAGGGERLLEAWKRAIGPPPSG